MSETIIGSDYEPEKNNKNMWPRWCKCCAHFGTHGPYWACYNVSWLRLIVSGPRIVPFDGTCEKFRYHKKYGGRSR